MQFSPRIRYQSNNDHDAAGGQVRRIHYPEWDGTSARPCADALLAGRSAFRFRKSSAVDCLA
ncbi:hypothetical protein SBA4_3670013 [Candidatus Sulfopaludibacter sp. SbA4]|nr:hypothetical protein SBA4_3670013 [Candidatus Sulfopaludibacter sp. SbA4]